MLGDLGEQQPRVKTSASSSHLGLIITASSVQGVSLGKNLSLTEEKLGQYNIPKDHSSE